MDLSSLKIFNHAKQFADWWGRELRDLVPRSVKNWMAEGIAQVLIEVNGGQARLYLCRANEQEELGQFNAALDSLEDIDSLRAAISAAIATQSAKSVRSGT